VILLVLASAAGVPAAGVSPDVTEGRVVYGRYCAACHGLEGDGHGPVAPILKRAPTDLRRLGQRYGMPLPVARIGAFIDGREVVRAHGTRDMPVWGERFAPPEPEEAGRPPALEPRIRAIIAYLETIQQKR
jgi:mono/diheme cytochrome c family protein